MPCHTGEPITIFNQQTLTLNDKLLKQIFKNIQGFVQPPSLCRSDHRLGKASAEFSVTGCRTGRIGNSDSVGQSRRPGKYVITTDCLRRLKLKLVR